VAHRVAPDPVTAAASAGLHYVTDDRPGITREMGALGFRYYRPDGRPLKSPRDLKRIRMLAVPPAWTRVWICPDPRGHLQATGRDARGRKQYRYHPEWRTHRDGDKFDRLEAFAAVLPVVRARTAADLAKSGLPREKVLATVVQLLERSLIRVGNDEYAKSNKSFGLTTLRDQHVAVKGSTLRFEFRGKSGKRHSVGINDRRLARIVKQCRDLPGQELFQYVDEDGRTQDVNSADVNTYLRDITGFVNSATRIRWRRRRGTSSVRLKRLPECLAIRLRSAASRTSIQRFSSATWVDRWRRSCRERCRLRVDGWLQSCGRMKRRRSAFFTACVQLRIAQGRPNSPPACDSRFKLNERRVVVVFVDDRLESVRSRARLDGQRVVQHDVDEFVVLELEGVSARLAVGNKRHPRASGDQVTDTMSNTVVVHHVNRE
jgi:DNA topoisomerase IB